MSAMLPEYPLSRDDDPAQTSPDNPAIDVPTQLTFAQEVRAERLAILWKATLFVVFMVWWSMIVISGGRNAAMLEMVLPALSVSIGCLMAGQWLRRERFNGAVWSYALGAIVAIALLMGYGSDFGVSYAPYLFPLLIFVVGLLLPVRATLMLALSVFGVAIIIPSLAENALTLSQPTAFAMVLTAVATALSAQVSGELYSIAEWALENYRRERATTYALFESREALQKSLTRQQALTEQVQRANSELEEARRAAEEAKNFRGQFLANMSHELRTPLNAIIGFSQTMLDFPAMYNNVELPPQYHQDMTQILNSGKILLNIINDILDLSKVDAGKLDIEIQPVDLDPILKGVLSTAVGLVGDKGEQIELQRALPDPLPVVMGDPLRVRQVLLNLYSNAAKFTDSGYIKLAVWIEGHEAIFAVEDTGIGISNQDKAGIFEEFRQGTAGRKKGRQGAGLGLAISQQLLRLMNGRLWFESVLGQGSTFYIALPLYVPAAQPDSAAQPEPASARTMPVRPARRLDAAARKAAEKEPNTPAPAVIADN